MIARRVPLTRWIFGLCAPAVLLLALAGCSDGLTAPAPGDQRSEASLNIIRLAANAPPLFSSTVSFWARRGQNAKGELFFRSPDGTRGEKFVTLDLSDRSLLTYPDGTPFATGDSVLITIRVTDPSKILIEFEPSGLRFDPQDPAELEIRYDHSDGDFNEDGHEDHDDAQIEQILGIWRQHLPADPFVRLATVRIEDLKELEARLTGFSRLAIAY